MSDIINYTNSHRRVDVASLLLIIVGAGTIVSAVLAVTVGGISLYLLLALGPAFTATYTGVKNFYKWEAEYDFK